MANGMLATEEETPPEAEAPEQVEGEDPGSNVTPEEQAQYDRFVDNAYKLIYEVKKFPTIMESVSGAGDPVTGLASTVASIVTRLYISADQAGKPISPDVMLHGGTEILEDLADTAEKAQVHAFTSEEIEAATLRAMDMAREILIKSGKVDPEELKQQFGQIVEADKQGKLGEVVPGIEAPESEPEPEQPPPAQQQEA